MISLTTFAQRVGLIWDLWHAFTQTYTIKNKLYTYTSLIYAPIMKYQGCHDTRVLLRVHRWPTADQLSYITCSTVALVKDCLPSHWKCQSCPPSSVSLKASIKETKLGKSYYFGANMMISLELVVSHPTHWICLPNVGLQWIFFFFFFTYFWHDALPLSRPAHAADCHD